MKRSGIKLLAGLAIAAQACVASAQAHAVERFNYRYISFSDAQVPPGFSQFSPVDLVDDGRIYGVLVPDDPGAPCSGPIGVWQNGRVLALGSGPFSPSAANNRGTVGGVAVTPDCASAQLALYRGGRVELIPPIPGEDAFGFSQVADSGIALAVTFDVAADRLKFYLYQRGRLTPIVLPPGARFLTGSGGFEGSPRVNDLGVVSATIQPQPFAFSRAARILPSGTTTVLEPVGADTLSFGHGINNRGEVLGYSTTLFSGDDHRIGFWRQQRFITWFVERAVGNFLTSARLLWNESGLIVATDAGEFRDGVLFLNSYVLPRPGLRLNVESLANGYPSNRSTTISDLNNRGDLLGLNWIPSSDPFVEEAFVLQRVHGKARSADVAAAAAPARAASTPRRQIKLPPIVERLLRRLAPGRHKAAVLGLGTGAELASGGSNTTR